MAIVCHHPDLRSFVVDAGLEGPGRLDALETLLLRWQTFDLRPRPNGVFAAVESGGRNAVSGYEKAWLRDNVHIAHALWRSGDTSRACRTLDALLSFQLETAHRFDEIVTGRVDPADVARRPHVRFHADTLQEIDQRWAHAQNDALGYALWLASTLWRSGAWHPDAAQLALFARQVAYFQALPYYEDQDSGHWEEQRRLNASSVGVVTAALESLAGALRRAKLSKVESGAARFDLTALDDLALQGRRVLRAILPRESPVERDVDAATMFLLVPLGLVDDETADAILEGVHRHLVADHGIRRYVGDSYWCGGYRELVSAETRSADYSETTSSRDRLLVRGEEAQWCLFDPLLSIYYGERFRRSGDLAHRRREVWHLRRALGQITGPGEWCAEGMCPEAWYLESRQEGVYRPNDQTPLAWTQANLMWAFTEFRRSLDGPPAR